MLITFHFRLTNYIPFITDTINNRLKKHDLNMVSVKKRNLFSLLVNNKDKSNTLEKNGVYKIHCAECDTIYIGQCGRALKHRISEPVSYTHLDVYKRQTPYRN